MLVASRYRSRRTLIGPVFFPIYVFALKAGLGVALLVTIVLAIVTTAMQGDPIRHAVQAMLAYPGRALMVFAWTTVGFAILDLVQSRTTFTLEWDPRTLPKVVRRDLRISRLQTACELLFTLAGLVWLLLVPRSPFLILGPAGAFADFAPIWSQVYVPILVLAVATVAFHVVNLARPYWTKERSLARIGINVGTILVLVVLLLADAWFVPAALHPTPPVGMQISRVVEIINVSFRIGFIVSLVIVAVEVVREFYRMKRRSQTPAPPESVTAGIAR
jgi:hypothetical protein